MATWKVTGGKSASNPDKMEYMPPLRNVQGMSDAQKETVRRYNAMRDTLIKHNLMERKEGE